MTRRRVGGVLAAFVVAAAVSVLSPVFPASASPPQNSFLEAGAYSVVHPDATLPGVNDFACRPTVERPEPVVLVHGFLENSYVNWASLGPKLTEEGHCVFALDYGRLMGTPFGGLDSLADSAAQLAVFVDEVRRATGSDTVAIVGHSKGGTVPRYYTRFLGGDRAVSKIVALAPPNYPTPGPPVDDALMRLNEPSDTVPGIEYVTVVTRYDQVVPYTASLLTGPGARNVVLQDLCPSNTVEHTGISYDAVAGQVVSSALAGEDVLAVKC